MTIPPPQTGRTHQLRVHCAHHLGLNMPMYGDGLYGQRAKRLHLHAQRLVIEHPYTKERMTFEAESPFKSLHEEAFIHRLPKD